MAGFECDRATASDGEETSLENAPRNLNPRRRPFTQIFGEDTEIIDLYGVDRGRSTVFRTPPTSPLPCSQESMLEMGEDAKSWIPQEEVDSWVPKEAKQCIHQDTKLAVAIEHTKDGSVKSKIVRSSTSDVPAASAERPEPEIMKERRRQHGWDDTTFLSRHWKKLAIYGGIFLVIVCLFLVFFWPRSVKIAVKQVSQTGEENYQLATIGGLIEVSLLHNLETMLENPNFASVKVRRAFVQGQWVMRHGNRPFFGNGTMEDKLTIPARSSRTIRIPYSIFFAGDPAQDPLYMDFLARCTDKDKAQRNVQIEYQVRVDLSYLGVPFKRKLNYSYSVPCPLSPSQIGAIIKTTGLKLENISLSEVGKNLKEIIDSDEADVKAGEKSNATTGKAEKMKESKELKEDKELREDKESDNSEKVDKDKTEDLAKVPEPIVVKSNHKSGN